MHVKAMIHNDSDTHACTDSLICPHLLGHLHPMFLVELYVILNCL